MNIDLGHDDEISAAFEAYDRLVRWEEHDSRLDAQDPIHERAATRGHIVALIANLAVAECEARSGDAELARAETLLRRWLESYDALPAGEYTGWDAARETHAYFAAAAARTAVAAPQEEPASDTR